MAGDRQHGGQTLPSKPLLDDPAAGNRTADIAAVTSGGRGAKTKRQARMTQIAGGRTHQRSTVIDAALSVPGSLVSPLTGIVMVIVRRSQFNTTELTTIVLSSSSRKMKKVAIRMEKQNPMLVYSAADL